MRAPTAEEKRHPDVREVYPHLVGKEWEIHRAEYDLTEVLAVFRSEWGDTPFLPVMLFETECTRAWYDWKSWSEVKGKRRIFPSDYRSGVNHTISWLADSEHGPEGDDRVCLAMRAVLQELARSAPNTGLILSSIITKLGNTLHNPDYQWHWRCSSFVPWDIDVRWNLDDVEAEVRAMPDLVRWIVRALKKAQTEGTLVNVVSRPPVGREAKLRALALEKARELVPLLEAGKWSEACDVASEVQGNLDQAHDCEWSRGLQLRLR